MREPPSWAKPTFSFELDIDEVLAVEESLYLVGLAVFDVRMPAAQRDERRRLTRRNLLDRLDRARVGLAGLMPKQQRILTVLGPGAQQLRQGDRLRCDGRWRRFLDVPLDDHEWPGTEGGTIVFQSYDDPMEMPR